MFNGTCCMFFLSFSSEMTVFIIDYETSILLQQAIAGRCRPVCSAGQGLLEAHGICGCLCTQTSANRGCGNCQAPLRLLEQYFRTEKAWIFLLGTKTAWIYWGFLSALHIFNSYVRSWCQWLQREKKYHFLWCILTCLPSLTEHWKV